MSLVLGALLGFVEELVEEAAPSARKAPRS
jgi:hypothetical protein